MACTNHPEVRDQVLPCARCGEPFCPACRIELRGRSCCVRCKREDLLDLRSGRRLDGLELASIRQRFVALFIDNLLWILLVGFSVFLPLRVIPSSGLLGLLGVEAESGAAGGMFMLFGCGFFLIILGSRVIYEGWMLQVRGQTLGKMVMNIVVVTPTGERIRPGQAWGRATLRFLLDAVIGWIAYIPAAFTQARTCIHDMAASTRVIKREVPPVACPYCGRALPEAPAGRLRCPHCRGAFEAMSFNPQQPVVRVLRLSEAGPAAVNACGRHQDNAAVGTCARCGIFMCELCRLECDGMDLCPGCFERLVAAEELPTLRRGRRNYAGLAGMFLLLGLPLFFIMPLLGVAALVCSIVGLHQARRKGNREDLSQLWLALLLSLIEIAGGIAIWVGLAGGSE